MDSFWNFINKKPVRLALAGVCFLLTLQGLARILFSQATPALLRGGGEVLLWGGWAAINAAHPYGRTIPNVNIAINIGFVMVILSWFARAA